MIRLFRKRLKPWVAIAKRGPEDAQGTGYAVAAYSKSAAKRIATDLFNQDRPSDSPVEARHIKVQHLEEIEAPLQMADEGEIDPLWALRHGVYAEAGNQQCPTCGALNVIVKCNGVDLYCDQCGDRDLQYISQLTEPGDTS